MDVVRVFGVDVAYDLRVLVGRDPGDEKIRLRVVVLGIGVDLVALHAVNAARDRLREGGGLFRVEFSHRRFGVEGDLRQMRALARREGGRPVSVTLFRVHRLGQIAYREVRLRHLAAVAVGKTLQGLGLVVDDSPVYDFGQLGVGLFEVVVMRVVGFGIVCLVRRAALREALRLDHNRVGAGL